MRQHLPQVVISQRVESLFRAAVDHYDKEVGGYLTGEVKGDRVMIDGLLVPEQEASGGHVTIDGEGQVKLRVKYPRECLRIVGHWHSHNTMSAQFSCIDDDNHDKIMATRDFMVFVVSARGEPHQVAVGVRNKNAYVLVESNYSVRRKEDNSAKVEMLRLIGENVKVPKYASFAPYSYGRYGDDFGWDRDSRLQQFGFSNPLPIPAPQIVGNLVVMSEGIYKALVSFPSDDVVASFCKLMEGSVTRARKVWGNNWEIILRNYADDAATFEESVDAVVEELGGEWSA